VFSESQTLVIDVYADRDAIFRDNYLGIFPARIT